MEPRRFLTGLILSATNFLTVIDGLAVVVALPAIESAYDASETQSQLILTAYLVPLGGGMLLGGRIGDRIGRDRALVYGLCGFTIACILAAVAPSLTVLLLARFVQGCSAALAVPSTFGMISDYPDPRRSPERGGSLRFPPGSRYAAPWCSRHAAVPRVAALHCDSHSAVPESDSS